MSCKLCNLLGFRGFQVYIILKETSGTPPKINIEPEHGELEEFFFLLQGCILRFHVNLPGCTWFNPSPYNLQLFIPSPSVQHQVAEPMRFEVVLPTLRKLDLNQPSLWICLRSKGEKLESTKGYIPTYTIYIMGLYKGCIGQNGVIPTSLKVDHWLSHL